MHRRLVPWLSVLAFLALSAVPSSAGGIVCPVPARAVTPCCGPPVAAGDAAPGCCPSSCCAASDLAFPCPASRLTISSSPNPSLDGRPFTITGRLIGGSSGTTVALWQKLPGQSAFTRVAHTTTDAGGDYKIVRSVPTNVSWYASSGTARSGTVLQRVRAQVKLVSWRIVGGLLTLNGRVSPSHRGERISFQKHTASGWRTIATAGIGRLSKFTVRHRFAHKGKVVLRVLFGGDARNMQSASAPLRLTIQ
jgi:hypothetical protein